MLVIKCARCKRRLFHYLKVGTGKVLYCYRERMSKVDIVMEGEKVLCHCGNVIGIDEGSRIKMRSDAFIHTGRKLKK
jgi:hypothetical protein